MNVNKVNLGTHQPDQLRNRPVEKTDRPDAEAVGNDASHMRAASVEDRVEISHSAREASNEQDDLKREVEFARRTMYSIPPMSPDRAEEILKRLEDGHYNAPDVRMKLSENLTRELTSQQPPEAGSEAESA